LTEVDRGAVGGSSRVRHVVVLLIILIIVLGRFDDVAVLYQRAGGLFRGGRR
jgi:hypothetical protein